MTITEFLLARIAEDEAKVSDPPEYDDQPNDMRIHWAEVGAISEVLLIGEARLRAECEAKRRIVAQHRPSTEFYPPVCVLCQYDICCDAPKQDYHEGAGTFPCPTLRALATVYAGHPDYREDWRPL